MCVYVSVVRVNKMTMLILSLFCLKCVMLWWIFNTFVVLVMSSKTSDRIPKEIKLFYAIYY